ELTAELTARRKQYNYYRDLLLSFGDDVPMVKLSEIATDMYRGSGIKRNEITDDGTPCVRYGEIYTTYNIWFDTCVSHTHKGTKTFEHGDILFAITGETVEEIAKSCAYMGHKKCFAGGDIVVMKHKQNPKYIAYALSTTDAQIQKSKGKVKSKVVHSNIPALKKIEIPLPTLDEQDRIVSILDRFDELTTNISSGLPAEIEARQKQYEYYRDKLLTFPARPAGRR
ncbi:MAG TPA: restriction endonuclease subunit S, partial [Clostridiales bacterium]|nr:restriction endonuclease subunit S [Clostridiales bacterium]